MHFLTQHKTVASITIGALVAMFFVVGITILGELYAPLKPFLKEQHYHHWIGKSVWSVVVFVIVTATTLIYYRKKDDTEIPLSRYLSLASIFLGAGTIVLYLFFVYEYLIKH